MVITVVAGAPSSGSAATRMAVEGVEEARREKKESCLLTLRGGICDGGEQGGAPCGGKDSGAAHRAGGGGRAEQESGRRGRQGENRGHAPRLREGRSGELRRGPVWGRGGAGRPAVRTRSRGREAREGAAEAAEAVGQHRSGRDDDCGLWRG